MTHRDFHDGRSDGLVPLESLDLDQVHSFVDLVQAMAKTAFGGRRLGEALDVLSTMVQEPDCLKVLTISGAMTIAKQGKIFADLIDRGVVDAVVATGALVAHGLTESFGLTHYKAPHDMDDVALFEKGYNRVYDTLEMESNLNQLSEILELVWNQHDDGKEPWSSSRICRIVGEELERRNEGPGILRSAFKRGVPVYIPAFTDSEMGLNFSTWAMKRGAKSHSNKGTDFFDIVPQFNPYIDLQDYAKRVAKVKSLGILTIGGGVPRNWAQQVGPYFDITGHRLGIDLPHPRFKFATRICPEPDHWGGLSGCTYTEGVSWGKFVSQEDGGKFAEVHSDATLALPLLAKALFEWMDKEKIGLQRKHATNPVSRS